MIKAKGFIREPSAAINKKPNRDTLNNNNFTMNKNFLVACIAATAFADSLKNLQQLVQKKASLAPNMINLAQVDEDDKNVLGIETNG